MISFPQLHFCSSGCFPTGISAPHLETTLPSEWASIISLSSVLQLCDMGCLAVKLVRTSPSGQSGVTTISASRRCTLLHQQIISNSKLLHISKTCLLQSKGYKLSSFHYPVCHNLHLPLFLAAFDVDNLMICSWYKVLYFFYNIFRRFWPYHIADLKLYGCILHTNHFEKNGFEVLKAAISNLNYFYFSLNGL